MIQIDGQKIKSLREQQGLTQLYLATAVDVTTDTISRWENKRYPSIKKDNGIRLAEALHVELEEILEKKQEEVIPEIAKQVVEPTRLTIDSSTLPTKKTWPVLLVSATLLGLVLVVLFFSSRTGKPQVLGAVRIAPNHCIAGQPFPVTIELSGEDDKKIAFILQENIPPHAKIVFTQPEPRQKRTEANVLKWITKVKVPTSFSYVMQLENPGTSSFELSGTIATAGGEDLPITGSRKIVIGVHHWADTDADNMVSDKEILTVYDKYAGIQGLEDEIDLIEEIWLGDGYQWNVTSQQYDIVE